MKNKNYIIYYFKASGDHTCHVWRIPKPNERKPDDDSITTEKPDVKSENEEEFVTVTKSVLELRHNS